MIKFESDAFKNLCSIQPFTLNYQLHGGVHSPVAGDNFTATFFLNACLPPTGVIKHKVYPVFKPNQFLWDNHLKKGDSKVVLYKKVIRDIMIEEDKFVGTEHDKSSVLVF